jgi:hypothetical protein
MANENVTAAGGRFKKQLKVKDLLETHDSYDDHVGEWKFCMALYEGIRAVINAGLVKRHEREPTKAYERRLQELYGFGYTKSVVEIFQHHLFKKTPQARTLDKLHKDEIWNMFYEDADLYGNTYESTIMEIALYAAVQGHMGVLVDKANTGETEMTVAQAKEKRVYPYISKYHPPAILNWQYDRDEYNRPFLSYLKLLDDMGETEQYLIWTSDNWEIWELPKDENGDSDDSNMDQDAKFVDSGNNPIGRIPFIWEYNFKSKDLCLGVGDVHEISRIDLSIIRNLSQIEQIINFAAFPMMRKPLRDAHPTDTAAPQQDDEVSVEAVLEFDPENPDSKPDWLEAKVQEPVQATWDVIIGKVAEIYRAANIGGMASTEPTKEPQSGVAKKVDFQMLNSKLVSKAINLENTENKILEYWLRWQNQWEEYAGKVKMARPKTFDIEDLATDLANALTAQTLVMSKTFKVLLQKQTARQTLPSANEQELADIDKEIEENVEKAPEGTTPLPGEDGFTDETKNIVNRGMSPDKTNPPNNQQESQQTNTGEEEETE